MLQLDGHLLAKSHVLLGGLADVGVLPDDELLILLLHALHHRSLALVLLGQLQLLGGRAGIL